MTLTLIIVIGLLLAYANGANDNFKGVATLFGSGTTSYRRALVWATATTGLGSVTALILARQLLEAFSGKGLVAPEVVTNPAFPAAVALAAGLTVLAATRLGLPISTTHGLIGALVGAGLVMSPSGMDPSQLASGFMLPLLVSPFVAITLAMLLYPPLRFARQRLGVTKETCVCIGETVIAITPGEIAPAQALAAASLAVNQAVKLRTLAVGDKATCEVRYSGSVLGVSAPRILDIAHYLSAGAVSFARGLNDTPKIAALLLIGGLVSPGFAVAAVALAIAIGGLLSARRVAHRMSLDVTRMNAGQGFTANIVTALLVIIASRFGMPVSTTHVSVGSLFGIGAVTRQANWRTIGAIALAWVITLPVAAVLGAGFALALKTAFFA